MRVVTILRRTLGALMLAQVLVGFALWAGYLIRFVGFHRTVGVLYVLVLWTISVIALVRRRAMPLGALGLAWGVVIAALGFSQQYLLVGQFHWVVRVVHLIVGWGAMPIAGLIERGFAAGPRSAEPASPADTAPLTPAMHGGRGS